MQSLSIQVQPSRSPPIDLAAFDEALHEMAAATGLVHKIAFHEGDENSPYANITFSTSDVAALWELIQKEFYRNSVFAPALKECSIVVCTGEAEWNDYVLLFHHDPAAEHESIPFSNPAFQRTASRPLN